MPLPERMKPASVSRKKVAQLASQAQQILAKIDAGAGPQESELLNPAPLTEIAFASNWLVSKLKLNCLSVRTTRVTTDKIVLSKRCLEPLLYVVNMTMTSPQQ